MFVGGASLFDLTSLLEYRNGETLPSLPEYIKKIEDKGVRVSTIVHHKHIKTFRSWTHFPNSILDFIIVGVRLHATIFSL